ncbi:mediator of RNA polymerase II transcription subunit 21 [Trichonephila clavipes]|nr:mediator of RNA polymerase II transcription subunit 21 [Trichonephila clavipes]
MADRLSQLQDAVNAQAENICNSLGVLQQCAPHSIFPEFDRVGPKPPEPPEDYCQMFATLISKTAKDIDVLIDSLPSEESFPELQESSITCLDNENKEAARILEEYVVKGELLLDQIRKVLCEIAQSQQEMQKISSLPNK